MARVQIPESRLAHLEKFLGNPRDRSPIEDDFDRAPGMYAIPAYDTNTVWPTNRQGVKLVRRATYTIYGADEQFFIEGSRWSRSFCEVKRYAESLKDAH